MNTILPMISALSTLAQTTEPVSHNFMGQLVIGLAVLAGLGMVGIPVGFAAGKRMKVDARMEQELLPRREFDQFRAEIQTGMAKMEAKLEATMLRVFDKMDERDSRSTEKIEDAVTRLTALIEKTGSDAHNARTAIWDKVGALRDRVASMEGKVNGLPVSPMPVRKA